MPHHLGERIHAAVAAIGHGQYQVAQRRHLELAERRLLERGLARVHGAGARLVIVVRAQQVETALQHRPHAREASRVRLAGRRGFGQAGAEELAAGEIGAGMAVGAAALADEDLQPALRGLGVGPGGGRCTARQVFAEPVERRGSADQRFLERGEGLAHIHEHGLVIGG